MAASPTSGRCGSTGTNRNGGSPTRYFGRFNPTRQDRWVFGDRDTGAYLRQFAWTKIVRHTMVIGAGVP